MAAPVNWRNANYITKRNLYSKTVTFKSSEKSHFNQFQSLANYSFQEVCTVHVQHDEAIKNY